MFKKKYKGWLWLRLFQLNFFLQKTEIEKNWNESNDIFNCILFRSKFHSRIFLFLFNLYSFYCFIFYFISFFIEIVLQVTPFLTSNTGLKFNHQFFHYKLGRFKKENNSFENKGNKFPCFLGKRRKISFC